MIEKLEPTYPKFGVVASRLATLGALVATSAFLYTVKDDKVEDTVSTIIPTYESMYEEATLVVSPHLDDEWQAWSMIENRSEYKVFLYATRSEATGMCESGEPTPVNGAYMPSPTPTGRWTESCEDARISSTLTFLERMSLNDESLPSDFEYVGKTTPLPRKDADICRTDSQTECNTADLLSFDVYIDRQKKGVVIVGNGGDGDLTSEEVQWMVEAIRDNPAEFLINNTRITEIVGSSYYNDGSFGNCEEYHHPDHLAVRNALLTTNFNLGRQIVASCASDSLATENHRVSSVAAEAFLIDTSSEAQHGAHVYAYSWLSGSSKESFVLVPDDKVGESIWHSNQYFVVNDGNNPDVTSNATLDRPAVAYAQAQRLQNRD